MELDNDDSRAWSPLLSGDLAATALEAVKAIAADLAATASLISPFGPDPEFSLGRGTAGQALFLAYLDAAVPGRGYGGLSRDLLEQAVEVVAALRPCRDQPLDPSRDRSQNFYTGRAGVVWTVEHLQQPPPRGRGGGGALGSRGAGFRAARRRVGRRGFGRGEPRPPPGCGRHRPSVQPAIPGHRGGALRGRRPRRIRPRPGGPAPRRGDRRLQG